LASSGRERRPAVVFGSFSMALLATMTNPGPLRHGSNHANLAPIRTRAGWSRVGYPR
jgi:hypothetical protein